MSDQQHGFRVGRSTATNLLEFVTKSMKIVESQRQLDVVYTDFSKAFDSLNHALIIVKLRKLGFCESLLQWLASYLFERTQYVEIDGVCSKSISVWSGVPQGSHLGPLIFILFIDDVVARLQYADCLLYADDLKIFLPIVSFDDVLRLQSDIDRVDEWCTQNKLVLNFKKCNVMSVYRILNPILASYHIGDWKLDRVEEVRDLGVHFTVDLSFRRHIELVASKAYSMLGFIMRAARDFSDIRTLHSLYFSLVRSVLEYAVVVWAPYLDTHIKRIERVQKKYMLFVQRQVGWPSYDRNLKYWENVRRLSPYINRCRAATLETLSFRRDFLSVVFLADVISSRVDSPYLLCNINIYAPSRNLRNRSFLSLDVHRTLYGESVAMTAMGKLFNSHFDCFDFNLSKSVLKCNLKNLFYIVDED